MSDLLPNPSSDFEKKLEAALARISDVDGEVSRLMDPLVCDPDFLQLLAVFLSVDNWSASWTIAQKRAVVIESAEIHKNRGTPASIRREVNALGYTISFTEHQRDEGPSAAAEFSAVTDVETGGITSVTQAEILRIIMTNKPLRAHLRDLIFETSEPLVAKASRGVASWSGSIVDIGCDATGLPVSNPWNPGDSTTLLGSYHGFDRSTQTIDASDNITAISCAYGVGPDFVSSTGNVNHEDPKTVLPDGVTNATYGSKDAMYFSLPGTLAATNVDTVEHDRLYLFAMDTMAVGVDGQARLFDVPGMYTSVDTSTSEYRMNNSNQSPSNSSGYQSGVQILTLRATGGATEVRVNGQNISTNPSYQSIALTSTHVFQDGSMYNGYGWEASVGAICFDTDASLSKAEKYEGWIAHETGLTSLLPPGHPYKSSPPTV